MNKNIYMSYRLKGQGIVILVEFEEDETNIRGMQEKY